MQKPSQSLLFFLLCLPSVALAQSFNIDFGPRSGTKPPDSYGAVPGQLGFWNLYPGGQNVALTGLDGSVSTVHIDMQTPGRSNLDIPGLLDGEEALMESIIEGFPVITGTISGLVPGTYDVYLYAWRPPPFMTTRLDKVGLYNGAEGKTRLLTQARPWPGSQIEGETYGKITIDVLSDGPEPGTIEFSSQGFAEDSAIFNGIQLVRVPAPMSALPLLGLGLALGYRRRERT